MISRSALEALREIIARPRISRNEWHTTEIGAFDVGHVAPFSCPGARPEARRGAVGDAGVPHHPARGAAVVPEPRRGVAVAGQGRGARGEAPRGRLRPRGRALLARRRRALRDLVARARRDVQDPPARLRQVEAQGAVRRGLLRGRRRGPLRHGGARPSPDADVPALYVVNAMIPSETGPMRVRVDADGHGYQMVICMQLTEETCADLEALAAPPADGARAVAPERRAALELLKMYCRVAPTEGQLDAKERGRFKVLAQIRNID